MDYTIVSQRVHTVLIMGLALRGPPAPPSLSNDVELVLGLTYTHTHGQRYNTYGKEGTVREWTKLLNKY